VSSSLTLNEMQQPVLQKFSYFVIVFHVLEVVL
jgi:hypothetical protein